MSCPQGRVSFYNETDNTNLTDAAICDATHYYMFSVQRGLFKGEMRTSDWYWDESKGATDVKNTYTDVTFVVIDGQVHMRSSHLPDEPFAPIDKQTCKVREEYTPFTSEGNLLSFTKTDEGSTEGSPENGYRYLRAT